INHVAIFVDQFKLNGVLANGPSRQPNRLPLVQESRLSINRVTHAILAALIAKSGIQKPKIEHDRVGILVGVIAFRTAISQQRLRGIDGPHGGYRNRGKIFALACRSRTSAGSLRLGGFWLCRAFGRAGHYLTAFCGRWFRGFAAALLVERHHLNSSIVFTAFVPWV